MTNEEIDAPWQQAMRTAIKAHDPFTRFEFARLVAAAPDMYEALQKALPLLGNGPAFEKARAALAKARGEA